MNPVFIRKIWPYQSATICFVTRRAEGHKRLLPGIKVGTGHERHIGLIDIAGLRFEVFIMFEIGFGHGDFTVEKGSGGPRFPKKRFKHRHVVIDEPLLRPQPSARAGFGHDTVIIRNGLVVEKTFRGKRFGTRDVLVGKGFAGKPVRHRMWGGSPHRAHR